MKMSCSSRKLATLLAIGLALYWSSNLSLAYTSSSPDWITTSNENTISELIIIDGSLSQVFEPIKPHSNIEVIQLESDQHGIGQISEALSRYHNLDAIHLLSHGSQGQLHLGHELLDLDTLNAHAHELATWGEALNDQGDLYLYGCSVGSGLAGQAFVAALAELTGADVAASDDLTGNVEDADWKLEVSVGDSMASAAIDFSCLEPGTIRLGDYTVNAGDTYTGDLTGTVDDDTITINGTVDGRINADDGSDRITNNGYVTGDVVGGNGDDFIDNNGTVDGSIYGVGGSDTIINSGSAGRLVGQGSDDTIITSGVVLSDIKAGSGNDTVSWYGGNIGGVIDGQSGSGDILNLYVPAGTVNYSYTGTAASGTLTYDGKTVAWQAFETLNLIEPNPVATTAYDDLVTVNEDLDVSFDVLSNDTVSGTGGSLTVVSIDTSTLNFPGNLEELANGKYTYHEYSNAGYLDHDYLAVGETATETFTYRMEDEEGVSSTATVNITITGLNDGPQFLLQEDSGSVTADSADPDLTATGTWEVHDEDTSDTHTVSASYNNDAVWSGGTLTTAQITVLTDGFTLDNGLQQWQYTVANADVQFLTGGQTVVFSYDLTLSDGNGGTETKTVTLTINGPDQLTLSTSSGDHGSVTAPGEGDFTYDYDTIVSVTATPDDHYHFVEWTGTAVDAGKVANLTSAETTVTLEENYTLIASFAIDTHSLTTSSSTGGSITVPGEGSYTYDYGTIVDVKAMADDHYHFVEWTGTAVDAGKVDNVNSATTTVSLEANYTLIANFAIDQQTLSTSSGDNGSVTVPGEGDFTYNYGTLVSVTATPDDHYHFVEWSGTAVDAGKVASSTSASTTIILEGDYTLVASFAIDQHTLTLSSTAGGDIIDPGEGDHLYDFGTQVEIQAQVDDPLFVFSHFEGYLWAGHTHSQYTVTGNARICAVFQSILDVLVVDVNIPVDQYENGSDEFPFDTIQEAIDVAAPGTTIMIRSGTYVENLELSYTSLVLTGVDVNDWAFPVLQGAGDDPVVSVRSSTDPNTLLQGLVINQGDGKLAGGLNCRESQLTLVNCLIVGNRCDSVHGQSGALRAYKSQVNLINCTVSGNYGAPDGAALFADSNSVITLSDSIVWDNEPNEILSDETSAFVVQYSDVNEVIDGIGNLVVDPNFASLGYWEHALNPGMVVPPTHAYATWITGDYHLDANSPCIDAGDPNALYDLEPDPNGMRINMGAYGGTPQATVTPID